MSKRAHPDVAGTDKQLDEETSWPNKRLLSVSNEPILFTRVRSLDELDKRTLQLQNKKLWEALTERKAVIAELRERIEQLENRQAKDDALLCVINRYWNQLDEDGLILLQRFDSDMEEEISTSTESFLKQLASWDEEEVPQKLQQRVHFSKRIIARLLAAYERLVARQSRLRQQASLLGQGVEAGPLEKDRSTESPHPPSSHETDETPSTAQAGDTNISTNGSVDTLYEEVSLMNKENQRLQSLCSNLHAKHRQSSLKLRELQDLAQTHSESAAEWQAKYEDIDYKLSQAVSQVSRLDHRLYEAQQRNKQLELELSSQKGVEGSDDTPGSSGGTVNRNKYNDLAYELEELRELLTNRTSELERVQHKLADKVGETEALRMQLHEIPEAKILEAPQYVSLKTQFNLLYHEASQLRDQLMEARSTLRSIRSSHLKHIQEMEASETIIQNQMRSEMQRIENQYSQLRRAHEAMELDFRQAIAHNEQAGPINSEMRSLISTLQTQNKELKAEVARCRRKLKDAHHDIESLKSELKTTEEELQRVRTSLCELSITCASMKTAEPTPNETVEVKTKPENIVDAETISPTNLESSGSVVCHLCPQEPSAEKKSDPSSTEIHPSSESADEVIRDLREQLRRSEESQKEMSMLLNMYKVIPKDQRDKAALLQCEAKLRTELSETKAELEKVNKRLADQQQQNAQLISQLQNQRPTRDQPFSKVSPVQRTPPVQAAAPAASPSTTSLKTLNIVSSTDSEAATNTISTSSTTSSESNPPESSIPIPATIPELQLELQLTRRRLHSTECKLVLCERRLATAQQQESVLLQEMDVTGEAYEASQEQNLRLTTILREKEDAHLMLMTERMKMSQNIHLLKEDRRMALEQARMVSVKAETLNRLLLKHEDKERLLLTNLETLEKELSARSQAQEAYKKKSLECQQEAEDLRVTVQKYQSQLNEVQTSLQEKASAFERISFGHQRLQEELVSIRRKYERLKKIEQSHNADEVLLAEIQDYKEQLTCPTCKTNRKDAVLTKCFHVFCLNCLKTRYETRNRKCPKCNATFGANDYHRIYLS